MKKLITHATVMVFAAAFVACGGAGETSEEPPNDETGPEVGTEEEGGAAEADGEETGTE